MLVLDIISETVDENSSVRLGAHTVLQYLIARRHRNIANLHVLLVRLITMMLSNNIARFSWPVTPAYRCT